MSVSQHLSETYDLSQEEINARQNQLKNGLEGIYRLSFRVQCYQLFYIAVIGVIAVVVNEPGSRDLVLYASLPLMCAMSIYLFNLLEPSHSQLSAFTWEKRWCANRFLRQCIIMPGVVCALFYCFVQDLHLAGSAIAALAFNLCYMLMRDMDNAVKLRNQIKSLDEADPDLCASLLPFMKYPSVSNLRDRVVASNRRFTCAEAKMVLDAGRSIESDIAKDKIKDKCASVYMGGLKA